jgi:cell wall-associated NlpC family hydrolase
MLVHSGDGYLGYISTHAIYHVTNADFTNFLDGSSVRMIADYRASKDLTIPAGARLKLISAQVSPVLAGLPTGEQLEIPADHCRVQERPVDQIEAIIASGEKLMGTKYVWGGRSSYGIDCSGLVQVAFATAGWHLPRDSNQQFYLGRLTATRWHTAAMRRGDTMYFLGDDGKIRHTAIYLGEGKYLNAELPAVRVGSIDPAHKEYDQRRHQSFAFAKRLVE